MKRLTHSIVSLVSGDAAGRAVGFAITVYLARILSPEGFGMFGIALAALGHLQLLASPGFQVIETRNVAAQIDSLSVRVGGVLVMRLAIATLLAGLAGFLLPHLVQTPELASCILLALLSLFPMAVFVDWVLQGKEDFAPLSGARVAGAVAYGVAVFALVRSSADVLFAPVAFFVGNLITAAVLFGSLTYRHGFPKLTWVPALWRSILIENAPSGAAIFFGQMVFNLPPLVVGYFLGTRDAGLYNAATKLIFLLLMADRILNALLLPALTRLLTTRPDDVPVLLTLMAKLVWLIGIPVVLCGYMVAPAAISVVFGSAYDGGALVTRILLVYVGLTVLNSIAVCTVIAAKGEGAYARRTIAGSAVLAIAVIVLTPMLGIGGAALGAALGEGATLVLMARKAFRLQPLMTSGLTGRSATVLIPLLAVGWWAASLPVIAGVGAIVVAWIVLMLVTRAVDRHDRARLRALLI